MTAHVAHAKILTMTTFRSNHAHFCNNEAFVTGSLGSLATERAVSQAEHDLKLFILKDFFDDSDYASANLCVDRLYLWGMVPRCIMLCAARALTVPLKPWCALFRPLFCIWAISS